MADRLSIAICKYCSIRRAHSSMGWSPIPILALLSPEEIFSHLWVEEGREEGTVACDAGFCEVSLPIGKAWFWGFGCDTRCD